MLAIRYCAVVKQKSGNRIVDGLNFLNDGLYAGTNSLFSMHCAKGMIATAAWHPCVSSSNCLKKECFNVIYCMVL